ncbi:hypothetical protein O181_024546 [Austropuccinia psidii MF-1]|uniref:Integrase zinc-binding domain-containing protein n=1 Tax=Austropuccinia psidii MF-1 TaxID=1389203 RepID=A0A9Q3CGX9_9BASI|nr:hypothetical protein [Austropuccinia psidii MF-1]
MLQKDVAEYCKTCDRFKKANKPIGTRLLNMIRIQEPRKPCEIVHMDSVTGLPPGGYRSNNACLVIVYRFSSTPIFLPCHKDDTAMDTAFLIWNTVVSGTGIFTNIITLELEYKTSIHASTNQTPAILEKGWNPELPQDSFRKNLVEIHPTAGSFKGMLYKARKHAIRCMEDAFAYAKDKWDKSHITPDFKVGNLVLVSTTKFNKIKVCKELKDSFAGPFVIEALHGENEIEVELSEELSNKHPTFPHIPPIESSGTRKITKVLKEKKLRTKKLREYIVRYSDPACEDEWLA